MRSGVQRVRNLSMERIRAFKPHLHGPGPFLAFDFDFCTCGSPAGPEIHTMRLLTAFLIAVASISAVAQGTKNSDSNSKDPQSRNPQSRGSQSRGSQPPNPSRDHNLRKARPRESRQGEARPQVPRQHVDPYPNIHPDENGEYEKSEEAANQCLSYHMELYLHDEVSEI